MISLYMKLRAIVFGVLEDVTTAATADYISWSINGGRQFANFYIQKVAVFINSHFLFSIGKIIVGHLENGHRCIVQAQVLTDGLEHKVRVGLKCMYDKNGKYKFGTYYEDDFAGFTCIGYRELVNSE